MKIKKFDEFVNELFAKSVNRGLEGGKRLGDRNKEREVAEDFIYAVYDCAEESDEFSELWLDFTTFLRLDDNDFREDEDDMFPEWGLNDVLDKYTLNEFIDLCWKFINGVRDKHANFDYDRFAKILEQ